MRPERVSNEEPCPSPKGGPRKDPAPQCVQLTVRDGEGLGAAPLTVIPSAVTSH